MRDIKYDFVTVEGLMRDIKYDFVTVEGLTGNIQCDLVLIFSSSVPGYACVEARVQPVCSMND